MAARLQRLDDRQLHAGAGAREAGGLIDCLAQRCRVLGQRAGVHDRVRAVETDPVGHRLRGAELVAGQHHRPYAGGLEAGDRFGNAGSNRVGQADQPEPNQLARLAELPTTLSAHGKCEHPVASRGQLVVLRQQLPSPGRRQRNHATAVVPAGAARQYFLRPALDRQQQSTLRRPVQRDHVRVVFGAVLDRQLRVPATHCRDVGTLPLRELDQRHLGGGAGEATAVAGLEFVVQRRHQQPVLRQRHPHILFEPDLLLPDDERLDPHPVLGQRAGLVEANHVHRTKVLDRVELAREDVALLQCADAGREQAGGDGGQAFRNCRHAERHCRAQQRPGGATTQQPKAENADAQPRGTDRQIAAEAVKFGLQSRVRLLGRLRQAADAAEHRALASGHHDGLAHAAGDNRAHEHHVVPLAHGGRSRQRIAGFLSHLPALAGQRRLVGRQPIRLDHPCVGGNRRAGLQDQQVAHHDLVRRDVHLLAIAQHARLTGRELAQAGHRLLGLALRVEADAGIGGDDGADRRRIRPGAARQRDCTRTGQQRNRNRLELVDEDLAIASASDVVDAVGAVACEALRGIDGSEPGAIRLQGFPERCRSHRVPLFAGARFRAWPGTRLRRSRRGRHARKCPRRRR